MKVRQSCKAAFESYAPFDSGAGDSVQRSCNLIVKGLLLTCAVFPRFKVPKPLQWDAHWWVPIAAPKPLGYELRFVRCQSIRQRPRVTGTQNSRFGGVPLA
jgi:hypothetical protein